MREGNKAYKLDSMGMMLPYTISKTRPLVFRVQIALRDEIDPDTLQKAVCDLATRFPILYTRLKRGFFWDYLAGAENLSVVVKDEGYPCRPLDYKNKEKPLMRILYRQNKVAIECSHLTCDGMGAATYMNSLAARYLELKGHTIEKGRTVLDYRDKPSEEELEDVYRSAYDKSCKRYKELTQFPAFLCLRERKEDYLQVISVEIPLDSLKKLMKEKYEGSTITEYLGAIYASAFMQLYQNNPKSKRLLKIAVPNNLRSYWGTNTLRNFVGGGHLTFTPDAVSESFHSVLTSVRREMKEILTKKRQAAVISQSAHYLDAAVVKIIPGFVKRAVLPVAYVFSELVWPHTSTFSNLGYVKVPPSLAEHIKNYMFLIGEMDVNTIVCAAAGINDVMTLAFSSVNESTLIQDYCIDFLKRDGLPIRVTVRN